MLLPCLFAILALASATQTSLSQYLLTDSISKAYALDFTSPAPHVFSSLRGLLQQLPNTFFPNGHSIVPCEIRPYTNLYHGRRDGKLPPSPEWFALDIEMAYGIMGSTRNSHMLTYQTVKPVRCLYFDGMSAALMGTGQLDSQMVFLYGNTSGPPHDRRGRGLSDEYARASGLCDWVRDHGLDVEGVVRMNTGFELIWCDFSSPSIRLVSHLNVTVPLLPEGYWDAAITNEPSPVLAIDKLAQRNARPTKSLPVLPTPTKNPDHSNPDPDPAVPPNWRSQIELEPFLQSQTAQWYRSATWHYGFSGMGLGIGENRVTALTCGFVSFYDRIFKGLSSKIKAIEITSLNLTAQGAWKGAGLPGNRTIALQQLTRRRRGHTLESIEPREATLMNKAVLHSLRQGVACSGVDWTLVSSDISWRYSRPLSEFVFLLSTRPPITNNATAAKRLLAVARGKAHSMLMPFLEYPEAAFEPEDSHSKSHWTLGSTLGQETLGRCHYAYTRLLYNSSGRLLPHINGQETTIIGAVEDILNGICSTMISVGFDIERIWLSYFNGPRDSSNSPSLPQLDKSMVMWQYELEELIAWLGWAGDSTQCDRLCGSNEFCYVPIWPMIFWGRGGPPGGPRPPPPKKGRPGKPPPDEEHPRKPPPRMPGHDWLEEGLWSPQCMQWPA